MPSSIKKIGMPAIARHKKYGMRKAPGKNIGKYFRPPKAVWVQCCISNNVILLAGGGGGAHPNKYIITYDILACFKSVGKHIASKLLDSSSQIKPVKSDFIDST